MIRLIGEHWEHDVRVRWYGDDVTNEVTVERWQDPQRAVDMVAAVNLEGAPTIDGMGKPVVEVPVVTAMAFCADRGIPWDQFKLFAQSHSKLAYQNAKSVHAVA